jgi:hypothetical protein
MLAMKSVRLALGDLLAADPATLAPAANANEISLVMADFVEDENLVIGDLTLATFTGSTALSAGLGTQPTGIDPVTQDQVITMKEPAGSWRWETGDAVNLPQTIYGFAFTTKTAGALLAVHRFDTPITLTQANQFIDIGKAEFRLVAQPMS